MICYLQGLFATKINDLMPLKRVLKTALQTQDLNLINEKIVAFIKHQFLEPEKIADFLSSDVSFHRGALRQPASMSDRKFLQGILIAYDLYALVALQEGQALSKTIGYFELEELKMFINNKFVAFCPPKELISFLFQYRKIKSFKDRTYFLKQNIRDLALLFTAHSRSKLIYNYLLLEQGINKALPFNLQPFLKKNFNPELFQFYLPYLLCQDNLSFSNPYEFIFFYLKQRLVLWKLLDPHKI